MGNCQATDAAAVIIQHPGGKVDRLYWPTSAAEVMKSNPDHYVALVTLYVSEDKQEGGGTARFTRVRLLKPKDMLLLGQVYRLITTQEVNKALRARKLEKMKKILRDGHITSDDHVDQADRDGRPQDTDQIDQETRQDRQKSSVQSTGKVRQWRPSLHSIAETSS